MLGSKTKRVAAYGKRAHRIVANDDFSEASGGGRTTVSLPVAVIMLDDPVSDISPLPSPIKPKATSSVVKKKSTTRKKTTSKPIDGPASIRRPLAPREPAVSINVESKQMARLPKKLAKKPPRSPIVGVEIIVLDGEGRTVVKERRFSKTGAQVNPVTTSPSLPRPKLSAKNTEIQKPRKMHRAKPAVIEEPSDSEPEVPIPRQKHATTRRRQIVISPPSIPSPSPLNRPSSPPPPRTSTSPRKYPSPARMKQRRSSPRPLQCDPITNKPRQLTPIRRGNKPFPQSPGSVISLEDDESDLDDADVNDLLKFADLSISDYQEHAPEVPEYLLPLLQECNQDSPHEFSSFINSFPFDPIVQSYESELAPYSKAEFRKVGEASYSEVFGIGSVVLKIVPLRDESGTKVDGHDAESPPPSDARDVLQEIAATRSMGELCEGFIKLLRTYVVRGKYPSLLLSLWDEYNNVKGSESIKPDTFSVSQVYAIIVLPNGGPDLEAYTFSSPSKNRWMQACSIFWQVVYSIADAEILVSFEHRDLHWGQILIQNIPLSGIPKRSAARPSMDDYSSGVIATIIDLGLSRMDASPTEVHWTLLEPEVFEGEGDYQFDIYRMMRDHNSGSWKEYRPLTNVMWLHYLLRKLISSKGLRAPAPRKTATSNSSPKKKSRIASATRGFSEQRCYECLLEMEFLLGAWLESVKPARSKRTKKGGTRLSAAVGEEVRPFRSAGDVLEYGVERSWVTDGQ
ncbi:hypothetical protein BDM02DRAFT_3139766 [Thelephora ganbajun]|uniref:Uncharacterized protein n=1 Tax=Thelephora ganbajun TaxID=370292 RepID=A0ACB6ZNK2_THEGA|nr:hypothetical protein BDM02DRAFT_3139766 [Thelephora ganbajun]